MEETWDFSTPQSHFASDSSKGFVNCLVQQISTHLETQSKKFHPPDFHIRYVRNAITMVSDLNLVEMEITPQLGEYCHCQDCQSSFYEQKSFYVLWSLLANINKLLSSWRKRHKSFLSHLLPPLIHSCSHSLSLQIHLPPSVINSQQNIKVMKISLVWIYLFLTEAWILQQSVWKNYGNNNDFRSITCVTTIKHMLRTKCMVTHCIAHRSLSSSSKSPVRKWAPTSPFDVWAGFTVSHN